MRFLIVIALIYLVYRYLKSWIASSASTTQTISGKSVDTVDDVMIKDPYCETYFPKRNGIRYTLDGKELFFCSKDCRDLSNSIVAVLTLSVCP